MICGLSVRIGFGFWSGGQSDPGYKVQEIRFAITTAASQSSATQVPSGSIVVDAEVDITTPYSGGATITIGNSGTPSAFMGTGDNNPQSVGLYSAHQDTVWPGATASVLVTVAGAPAAGAGFAIIRYVPAPQN